VSKALRDIQAFPKTAIAKEALSEVERLRALNAELVEALEVMLKQFTKTESSLMDSNARCKAHAALAKAKEQS
jgi:hypothetical protein